VDYVAVALLLQQRRYTIRLKHPLHSSESIMLFG
jgi:hypothetical protein